MLKTCKRQQPFKWLFYWVGSGFIRVLDCLSVSEDALLWLYLVTKGLQVWPLHLGSNSIWPVSSVLITQMLPKIPGDKKNHIWNLSVEGCSGSTEKSRLAKSHVIYVIFQDVQDTSVSKLQKCVVRYPLISQAT